MAESGEVDGDACESLEAGGLRVVCGKNKSILKNV